MYDPNWFTLNLEQMLSGKPLDTAIGVAQVLVRSARGIKGLKIGGGTPDPYVSLNIENRAELCRTKHKTNTYVYCTDFQVKSRSYLISEFSFNPTWMETKFILINSLKENLVFNLMDFNDHRKDTALGSVTFSLSKLLEDQTVDDIVSSVLQDGKDNGELRYDVNYFPVIEAEEGKEEVLDSSMLFYRSGWRSEPHDPFFVKLSVLCVL